MNEQNPVDNDGLRSNAFGTKYEEIPVSMLTDIITDQHVQFMNAEEATLEELADVIDLIKAKDLKKLAFGCKNGPGIMKPGVNTLAKARLEQKEVVYTEFVLEKLCFVIGLKVRRNLKELFLQNLPITLWVPSLRMNRAIYLRKLSLRYCRLSDYGCKSLFGNISPSITHIDLTGNGITSKGTLFICDAIKVQNAYTLFDTNLKAIQYLCLNNNPIGNEGLGYLVDALFSDFSVKSIEVRNCNIDELKESLILAVVNTSLEVFDIRSNPIKNKKQVNKLIKLIQKNNPPRAATFKWSSGVQLFEDEDEKEPK
ncbi:hypothetical protein O3M35_002924 [Rhynocoris fuscipes]|uniref:Uncharacterized protein n=1 Tax=Rhynocoris fuscipes TaxID=488301 RepID=A0AAW1CNE5_9HEMI